MDQKTFWSYVAILTNCISNESLNTLLSSRVRLLNLLGSIDSIWRKNHYANTFGSLWRVLQILTFQIFDIFQN